MDYASLLGADAEALLTYKARIPAASLTHPGPSYMDDIMLATDRSSNVLRNMSALFNHGRLGGTGYVSILPVDQGIEHSGAASFTPNPAYFDPANILYDPYRFRNLEAPGRFCLLMLLALVFSVVTARLGFAWGDWMRRMRR